MKVAKTNTLPVYRTDSDGKKIEKEKIDAKKLEAIMQRFKNEKARV